MTAKVLDTVLLFALPASGKSEVRKYLASLDAESCRKDFHLGPTLQLDDYPYVHLMHRIDDELRARGWKNVYYKGPTRPFIDDWEWATLVELLNEDYRDLVAKRIVTTPSAAQWLFDRFDAAHKKVGLAEVLGEVPYRIRREVAEALEPECRELLEARNTLNHEDRAGKTIVIEAARGGANGSAFPLSPPYGYETAFAHLDEAILERSSVLYVWVEPEHSRQKNIERGRPDGQGSILHHSVPMEVMLGQYGCDDMGYLLGRSDRPNTVRVERTVLAASGKHATRVWHLPVARFDNRKDLTSFVREDKKVWRPADANALHAGLREAFSVLARV